MFEFLPFSRIYKTYTTLFFLKKELFSNDKSFQEKYSVIFTLIHEFNASANLVIFPIRSRA